MYRQHSRPVWLCALLLASGLGSAATAQDFSTSTSDSPVGYIDNAVIRDRFRFRFDHYSNTTHPDRAEYMFPLANAIGGRATQAVRWLDWEEYRAYTELAFSPVFSLFADFGIRTVDHAFAFDPIGQQLDTHQAGGSDSFVGFRYGLLVDECQHLTAQFKVGIPTGDPRRCLGTGHSSIEVGLLYHGQVDERLVVFGELKDWVSINAYGDAFPDQSSSNVLSYGLGVGYDIKEGCVCCQTPTLTAVFETVGWTVLDGIRSTGVPADFGVVVDADGETIVNLKYGIRYTRGKNTVYAGYGNSVTGSVWYENVVRVEYTRNF